MNYFKHSSAVVESDSVGDNTKIGAFTHVLAGAKIGASCNIGDHVFIDNDVVIGDRVTIKSGVQLSDGLCIEDDVFVGQNVTFMDKFAQSDKPKDTQPARTVVQSGAYIGANSTICDANIIGKNSRVYACTVVSVNIPPNAIVEGNPARISGYVSTRPAQPNDAVPISVDNFGVVGKSEIPGVRFVQLPVIPDLRGTLSFAQHGQYLDFIPKRFFLVFDVLSREVRGEHAHKTLHQFLVCVKGSITVMVDNGCKREEYLLNTPGAALHIPPMVWGVQYKYSTDGVLLVLASDLYDPDDYIRNYDEFLESVKK